MIAAALAGLAFGIAVGALLIAIKARRTAEEAAAAAEARRIEKPAREDLIAHHRARLAEAQAVVASLAPNERHGLLDPPERLLLAVQRGHVAESRERLRHLGIEA